MRLTHVNKLHRNSCGIYFSDMATASCEEIDQQLKCSICLEKFVQPKFLSCGHTFCKQCLEGVVRESEDPGVIRCPECRIEMHSSVDELPNDFRIERLKALQRSMQAERCGVCKDTAEDQLVFCMQCLMLLCHMCTGDHRKKFAYHKVTMRSRLSRCIHHGELRIYFCTQCKLSVCKCCVLSFCLTHETKEITEIMAADTNAVQQYMKQTKLQFKEQDQRIHSNFNNIIKEIQEHFQKAKVKFQANFDQLISLVERARQETIIRSQSDRDNCLAILNVECNREPDENGDFDRNVEAMTVPQIKVIATFIPNDTVELGQLHLGTELSMAALPPQFLLTGVYHEPYWSTWYHRV